MAGRGRGFSFRKTEDSKQDEDGNKLDVTASSSVSSFATPLGRGRGQLFQLNQRPPSQFYSDEQSDISSAISYPSTGRGFGNKMINFTNHLILNKKIIFRSRNIFFASTNCYSIGNAIIRF